MQERIWQVQVQRRDRQQHGQPQHVRQLSSAREWDAVQLVRRRKAVPARVSTCVRIALMLSLKHTQTRARVHTHIHTRARAHLHSYTTCTLDSRSLRRFMKCAYLMQGLIFAQPFLLCIGTLQLLWWPTRVVEGCSEAITSRRVCDHKRGLHGRVWRRCSYPSRASHVRAGVDMQWAVKHGPFVSVYVLESC